MLHVVLDNYHTHKHDDIAVWLAKHPQVTLTHADLRIMAQSRRGVLRDHHAQAIRRGSYASVPELVAAIRTFIDGWNERCHPVHLDEDGRRDPASRP